MACGAFWRDRAQINEEHAALAKLVHGEHEQRRQRPPSVSAQQLSTDIIEKWVNSIVELRSAELQSVVNAEPYSKWLEKLNSEPEPDITDDDWLQAWFDQASARAHKKVTDDIFAPSRKEKAKLAKTKPPKQLKKFPRKFWQRQHQSTTLARVLLQAIETVASTLNYNALDTQSWAKVAEKVCFFFARVCVCALNDADRVHLLMTF